MAGEMIKGGITVSSLASIKQGSGNSSIFNCSKSITNLQQSDKLLKMEKKVLEAKESYVDANLAKLYEDTFKSLLAWKTQLQNREKGLIEKADRVNNFIRRTREVYGYNDPSIGVGNGDKVITKGNYGSSDSVESSGDGAFPQSTPDDEDEYEENDDLGQKKRKVKIMENKRMKTMRDYTRLRNIERMKKDEEDDALLLREMNGDVRHGAHLHTDADAHGWTIPKIQRLYLRYCRAESFRKALAYQKRYLTMTSPPRRPKTLGGHRKWSLKSIACVVVAVIRMKFLVGRYHQRIGICSTVKKRKNPTTRKLNKPVVNAREAFNEDEENENDGSYLATHHMGKPSPMHRPLATCDPNTPTKDNPDCVFSTTDSGGCHSDELPLATNINKSYPRILGTDKTDSNRTNDTVWKFHWKAISPKTYAPDSMTVSYPRCIAKKDVSEDSRFRSDLQKEEKFLGDAELSLSSYMKTLEDLQTKLKLISS